MTQEDIVLLIADGARGPYGLDPVRLMKGCFLAAKLGPDEWEQQLFAFRPYDYGPFDSGVYTTRDRLAGARLIDIDRTGRYERYTITDAGRERVAQLEAREPDVATWLRRIGAYVSSKPFAKLLREIYEKYPAYKVRSVFTG